MGKTNLHVAVTICAILERVVQHASSGRASLSLSLYHLASFCASMLALIGRRRIDVTIARRFVSAAQMQREDLS